MASTAYDHHGGITEMYAVQEQFRGVTKMACDFVGLNKIDHSADVGKMVTFCHRFAALGTMVRNAGQLPQPFWLGDACGGGSCSAARCAART